VLVKTAEKCTLDVTMAVLVLVVSRKEWKHHAFICPERNEFAIFNPNQRMERKESEEPGKIANGS